MLNTETRFDSEKELTLNTLKKRAKDVIENADVLKFLGLKHGVAMLEFAGKFTSKTKVEAYAVLDGFDSTNTITARYHIWCDEVAQLIRIYYINDTEGAIEKPGYCVVRRGGKFSVIDLRQATAQRLSAPPSIKKTEGITVADLTPTIDEKDETTSPIVPLSVDAKLEETVTREAQAKAEMLGEFPPLETQIKNKFDEKLHEIVMRPVAAPKNSLAGRIQREHGVRHQKLQHKREKPGRKLGQAGDRNCRRCHELSGPCRHHGGRRQQQNG